MDVLDIKDLSISYDHVPVLWNASLSVPKGKLAGIVGPNGSGKTSFLKAIMELIPAESGQIKLFNKQLSSVRDKIAYVPQKDAIDWDFPATVKDVVMMGRYGKKSLFKALNKKDEQVVMECLAKVEMLDFVDRHISELSGGQKQRVFIARALAQEADLYLMDEPFAGVDIASEQHIMQILIEMQQEGKSIFVVHHDLQSAIEYFDWIILINKRVVASGPLQTTFTTENLKKTYGGNLTLLSEIGQILKEKQYSVTQER